MVDIKHIKRNYNSLNVNREHYDKDYWEVEINRFNKQHEAKFLFGSPMVAANEEIIYWKAWTGYKAKNSDSVLNMKYDYYATKDGEYRLECLYSVLNPYSREVKILLDGEELLNDTPWGAYPNYHKRNIKTIQLKKGLHTIQYIFDPKIIWLGFCVKKVERYWGNNKNGGVLTPKTVDAKIGDGTSIDELSFSIMYDHSFDETLSPNDKNANHSGYIFDYRDEVNFFIKDYDDNFPRIFGGYISTVSCDDDLTKLTFNCAGRLVDGDKRYCYSEITMLAGDQDMTIYDNGYSHVNADSYAEALRFVVRNIESNLDTNIPPEGYLLEGEERITGIKASFGCTQETMGNLILPTHVDAEPNENFIILRNRPEVGLTQDVLLFNADNDPRKRTFSLNKNPNFFINYRMGEAMYSVESTKNSVSNTYADGSLTEDQVWEIFRTFPYGGWTSRHDPIKAWEVMGTKKGHSADCYDATAWLYYVFNFKVGIPARDIVYAGSGNSGTHHTIQLFKNNEWINPTDGYKGCVYGLGIGGGARNGDYKVSREPPSADGTIPEYHNDWYGNKT